MILVQQNHFTICDSISSLYRSNMNIDLTPLKCTLYIDSISTEIPLLYSTLIIKLPINITLFGSVAVNWRMMQYSVSLSNYSNADTILEHGISIKLSRVRLVLSAGPGRFQHSPVLNDGITLRTNTFTVYNRLLSERAFHPHLFVWFTYVYNVFGKKDGS